MTNNCKIPVFLLTVLLLPGACKKVSNMQGESRPDAQIGFFNASEYVKSQVQGTNRWCLLWFDANTPDSSVTAGFNRSVFNNGEDQYPNDQYNVTLILPWLEYIRLYQGAHTITLMDTSGHHPLVTAHVSTTNSVPITVYFADNLGSLQYWALPDTVTVPDGMVGLRVMDLSPDAGDVFITVANKPATGFPSIFNYGQVTSFVPWPDSASAVNIRFYQVGDSVDILTSTSISVSPGHSYNVVLNGYLNNESFPDPVTGNTLSFGPDLNIKTTQNN